jgi:hypothetical protein
MKNWTEVTDKLKELLALQEVPLPDFDITTDIGRSRLILYCNKYLTEENLDILRKWIYA